jgi:hypothetical protein
LKDVTRVKSQVQSTVIEPVIETFSNIVSFELFLRATDGVVNVQPRKIKSVFEAIMPCRKKKNLSKFGTFERGRKNGKGSADYERGNTFVRLQFKVLMLKSEFTNFRERAENVAGKAMTRFSFAT